MPKSVIALLASCKGNFGKFNSGGIWMVVPMCLIWCLWRERNLCTFEGYLGGFSQVFISLDFI